MEDLDVVYEVEVVSYEKPLDRSDEIQRKLPVWQLGSQGDSSDAESYHFEVDELGYEADIDDLNESKFDSSFEYSDEHSLHSLTFFYSTEDEELGNEYGYSSGVSEVDDLESSDQNEDIHSNEKKDINTDANSKVTSSILDLFFKDNLNPKVVVIPEPQI